ncbi:MAG: hypothetical protein WDZ88_01990 [Candidatus Paceibacterota bacterium]
MTRFSLEILRDKYNSLPEDLRNAVIEVPANDLLYDIAERHDLDEEQIKRLADETGYVILGLTPAREFFTHLRNGLKLDSDTLREIAQEINDQIFSALREKMRQHHGDAHVAPAQEETKRVTPATPSYSAEPARKTVSVPNYSAHSQNQGNVGASISPAKEKSVFDEPIAVNSKQPTNAQPSAQEYSQNQPIAKEPEAQGEAPSASLGNIHEQKMAGAVSLPSVEKKLVEEEPSSAGTDPYREPI